MKRTELWNSYTLSFDVQCVCFHVASYLLRVAYILISPYTWLTHLTQDSCFSFLLSIRWDEDLCRPADRAVVPVLLAGGLPHPATLRLSGRGSGLYRWSQAGNCRLPQPPRPALHLFWWGDRSRAVSIWPAPQGEQPPWKWLNYLMAYCCILFSGQQRGFQMDSLEMFIHMLIQSCYQTKSS